MAPSPLRFPGRPRAAALFLLSFAGVVACAASSGAPAPASPAGAAESGPALAAPADASPFESVARRLLERSPERARSVGLHEYDGQVGSLSERAIAEHIRFVRELKAEIDELEQRATSADERLDAHILAQTVATELFELTVVESFRRWPIFYSEPFSVSGYLVRDYAPKAVRARALLTHLKNGLPQVGEIRKNLRPPLSEPVVATAIDVFGGLGQYLRGEVQKFLENAADEATKAQAKPLALRMADEAEAIATWLREEQLPRADQSHVLGRERYEHLLAAQEALSTPIEELERLAEADLARNRAAYDELAGKVEKSRPAASELLGAARDVVQAARSFVVDHRVVTIPLEPNVEVKETPPFMRWNSAFLDSGGPLEPASLAAYYYITPPDPSWPPAQQQAYVLSRGQIVATSVHEVFPGHYLQGLWQRSAPTFVQKIFTSYSFSEGWAHYVEQMMVDEGFESDLPEVRLGQISDALLRDCRFLASIGIHVRGMSVADAQRRFAEDCVQDEATARQQAVRGTFDPGYFAYTLGKLQILSLREEAERALGDRFSLQRFHDALLSHGAPPVPLIRERVLAELSAI